MTNQLDWIGLNARMIMYADAKEVADAADMNQWIGLDWIGLCRIG
jgi:hypothetical protein